MLTGDLALRQIFKCDSVYCEMCAHNGKLKTYSGCSFPSPMIPWCDFSRLLLFPLELRNAISGFMTVFTAFSLHLWWCSLSLGQYLQVCVCVCVCVLSYLCWFSLSSCCLRRVGRNLLLASAASMSSISRLLRSRMAERMRRLSSRSKVPSSCTHNMKRQTKRGHEDKRKGRKWANAAGRQTLNLQRLATCHSYICILEWVNHRHTVKKQPLSYLEWRIRGLFSV